MRRALCKEEFEEFFKSQYSQKIDQYFNDVRRNSLLKNILAIGFFITIVAASVIALNKVQNIEEFIKRISENTRLVIMCYFGILVILLVLILYLIRRSEIKKQYNKLFRDIVAFIGDRQPKTALRYEPKMLVSEESIKRMGLFNFDVLKLNGNDYIYVQYDNKELCFSDLRLYYQTEEQTKITKNERNYIMRV